MARQFGSRLRAPAPILEPSIALGTDGLHDSPLEGGVTSEPVSEFPQRFSVFTLRSRARAHAREGKVDVVRVELIPGMICGIWKQGFAGWKF